MKPPRDLTRAQFKAALARAGLCLVGLWITKADGSSSRSIGTVYNPRTGKMLRRASLARALREFAKED